MIPNKFHFVHLTDGGSYRPFGLHHYLCIKSCHDVNEPDEIVFYCNVEPTGEWWDKAKQYVRVVLVEPPTEIFGHPITQLAHKSDVIRLQVLMEEGGIYADMDTLFIKPYTPFLNNKCVLGEQNVGGAEGLCPAVIMSESGDESLMDAEFIKTWLINFQGWFQGGPPGSDGWCTHSVILPAQMAKQFPDKVFVADYKCFFWPLYHGEHLKWLFEDNKEFPDAYSFHLWESQSKGYLEKLTIDDIQNIDTTYNIQARKFL